MRGLSLIGLVSLVTVVIAGSEFPVVDGVIGGVPKDKSTAVSSPKVTINETITPGTLRYVENSGICETTVGVYQASGYADLSTRQSMWFWFFGARSNPDTAPLALWLNGLFQDWVALAWAARLICVWNRGPRQLEYDWLVPGKWALSHE